MVRERDLHREISLRGPDVSEGPVLVPGEPRCDCQVCSVAEPGHRREELLQPGRIRVERFEERCVPGLCLVLNLPGSERFGEVAPEAVQAVIGHLQDAAEVGGFPLVEE